MSEPPAEMPPTNRRFASSGNLVPTQRTIASKKLESGPASSFHFSPSAFAARPSFHGFQFQPFEPGVAGAPRGGDLWSEVRPQIAADVARALAITREVQPAPIEIAPAVPDVLKDAKAS
mgnify:CR=1 FL=1